MARHRGFTREKFLRAVTEELRREYLARHKLPPPAQPLAEEVMSDILAKLGDAVRAEIDEELQCINDVADRGMDCLERAYREHRMELDDKWTRERAAMFIFLRSQDAFEMAYDLYLWRAVSNTMSHHQLPEGEVTLDDRSLASFQASVEEYFGKHAKGRTCRLRHYEDDAVHVVLIGRGDYMQTQLIMTDAGEVSTTFFRPAKEDVLLYDSSKRLVSVKTSGKGDADRDEYLGAFVRSMLGKLPDELSRDSDTVSLGPIQKRSFSYTGNESIEWVRLVELHVRLRGATEARVGLNSLNLLTTLQTDLPCVQLKDCELLSAKLKFKLQGDGVSARPITVEIRPPEHTSLNKRREAEVVESYLREQGVLLA